MLKQLSSFLLMTITLSLILTPMASASQNMARSARTMASVEFERRLPVDPTFIRDAASEVLLAQAPTTAGGGNATSSAIIQADADVEASVNTTLWFAAGCLLSWVGILLGYVIEPSPPATAIVGKSPEYVLAYSMRYKEVGKKKQGKVAIIGCVVGGAVWGGLYVLSMASLVAASTY